MATIATIRTRITQIDTILSTGAKSVTVDGVTTQIDLDQLREERRRLEKQLPEHRHRRPLAYKPMMG